MEALLATHEDPVRAQLTALQPDDRQNPVLYAVLVRGLGAPSTHCGDDLVLSHRPLGTSILAWDAWYLALAECRSAATTRLPDAGCAADHPLLERSAACQALVLSREPDLLPHLQALAHDPEPKIRAEIATCMVLLQNPSVLPLQLALAHDGVAYVRLAARTCIPNAPLPADADLPRCLSTLSDADAELRAAVVQWLGQRTRSMVTSTQGRTDAAAERFQRMAAVQCAVLAHEPQAAIRLQVLQYIAAYTAQDQGCSAAALLNTAGADPDPVNRRSAVTHLALFTQIDRRTIEQQLQEHVAEEGDAQVRAAIQALLGAKAGSGSKALAPVHPPTAPAAPATNGF